MSDQNNEQIVVKIREINLKYIELNCSDENFKGDISFWVDGILFSKFINYTFDGLEIPISQDIIDGKLHDIYLETSAGFSTSFNILFDPRLLEIRKKSPTETNYSIENIKNADLENIYRITQVLNRKIEDILQLKGSEATEYDNNSDNIISLGINNIDTSNAFNNENTNNRKKFLDVEFDHNILLMLDKEFDKSFYKDQIEEDIEDEGYNLLRHYLVVGEKIGFSPNKWFIPQLYFEANRDVHDAGLGAFYHYIITGKQEGRHIRQPLIDDASYELLRPFFDAGFYSSTYQVEGTNEELFNHFLAEGWKHSWDPNRYFSVSKYLELNPDIQAAKINPLVHYVTYGKKEGRVSNIELGFRYKTIENMKDIDERNTYVLIDQENPSVDLYNACDRLLSNNKAKVFSISHDNFIVNVGGLQLCVRREANSLIDKGYDHIHLYPTKAMLRLDRSTPDPLVGVIINKVDAGAYRISTIKELMLGKLNNDHKNIFIIHSFLGHNINSITKLFKFLDLTTGYFWIHDYAAVCSGLNLLRNDVEFCNAPNIESNACSLCVYKPERTAQAHDHKEFFDAFDITLVSPSNTALSIWQRGGISKYKSAVVHPHGKITHLYTQDQHHHKIIRVAFLGFAADHKGWPVFTSLINECVQDKKYEFYHFASYKADGNFKHVEVNAQKSGADMTKQLIEHEIDIVIIWSICAETFCLVAHEAAAAGVKIITRAKSGYLSDFVSHGSYGVVLNKEQDLINLFNDYDKLYSLCNEKQINVGNFELSNLTADLV